MFWHNAAMSNKLKETVKSFRVGRGWTQTEFAEFAGVSRRTIARVEADLPISERLAGLISAKLNSRTKLDKR